MGNWEWSRSKDQALARTPLDSRSLQIIRKQQGLTLNLLVPLSQDHANLPPSTSTLHHTAKASQLLQGFMQMTS